MKSGSGADRTSASFGLVFFFAFLFGLLCVWGEQAQAQDLRHAPSGLVLPVKVSDFERASVTDYETQAPGLGFAYRYRGAGAASGTNFVLYVYNLRLAQIPSDLADPKFGQIRQMTRQEIAQTARSRDLSPRSVAGGTLSFGEAPAQRQALFDGFVLESRLSSDSPKDDSAAARNRGYEFAALWSAKNHFIKLKVSRSEQSKLGPEQVRALVQELLLRLH